MELDRHSDWRGMRAVRHMGLGESTAGKHNSSMTSISEQSLKLFGAMLEEMQQDCITANIYSRYCSLPGSCIALREGISAPNVGEVWKCFHHDIKNITKGYPELIHGHQLDTPLIDACDRDHAMTSRVLRALEELSTVKANHAATLLHAHSRSSVIIFALLCACCHGPAALLWFIAVQPHSPEDNGLIADLLYKAESGHAGPPFPHVSHLCNLYHEMAAECGASACTDQRKAHFQSGAPQVPFRALLAHGLPQKAPLILGIPGSLMPLLRTCCSTAPRP